MASALEKFLHGYFEAILFASTDEDGEPFDSLDDLDEDTETRLTDEAEKFWAEVEERVEGHDPERVGHDFWFTRNRHGAGFWDGDYDKALGEELTDLSHSYGEVDIYQGDDGMLYASP